MEFITKVLKSRLLLLTRFPRGIADDLSNTLTQVQGTQLPSVP